MESACILCILIWRPDKSIRPSNWVWGNVMNFDFAKTLALVKGGLFEREATWKTYFEDCPDWKQTAIVLTGPLLIASSVLSVIFSRLFGTFSQYAYSSNFFTALVTSLLMGVLAFVIATLVFGMMAKVFKGKNDFSRSFAAVSFAAIPAWVATIAGSLVPWLGGLIMLAGGIMSLVFMYKIMPLALGVPDDKRVVHFISSIVVIIIINMMLGFFIAPKPSIEDFQRGAYEDSGRTSRGNTAPSIVSEFERQGRIMEQADADEYEPPSDGELSERQVKDYIKVLDKTRAVQEEYAAKIKKMGEEMKAKEEAGESPSFSDLTNMYKSGIGGVASVVNTEMEVVKTGGGNWAEHQWVKEQLRVAYIQQGEGSDAIKHNYKLYEKYKDELD